MSTVTRDYWRDVELKYFSPIMEMWTQLTNVLFNGRWEGGGVRTVYRTVYGFVSDCTVLYYIVLTVLYYAVPDCTVLYYIVLTVLYYAVLYCTVLSI